MDMTNLMHADTTPAPQDLEALLLELARYGETSVIRLQSGWSVTVAANVTPVGARFTVRSEFGMDSPTEAARQCLHRLHAAINTLAVRT